MSQGNFPRDRDTRTERTRGGKLGPVSSARERGVETRGKVLRAEGAGHGSHKVKTLKVAEK